MADAYHLHDLIPAATESRRGTVKPDGTTITADSDGTLHGVTYTLPTAATYRLGGVMTDGDTITITTAGTISVANKYIPKKATSSTAGMVKPDNETIAVDSDGVISAVRTGVYWDVRTDTDGNQRVVMVIPE